MCIAAAEDSLATTTVARLPKLKTKERCFSVPR